MIVSFIGSAGIPNRYGGFEAFLEHCAPIIAARGVSVTVTCDAKLYPDQNPNFGGVHRVFIPIPANGASSVIHDLVAFFRIFFQSQNIIVLGVSGGIWFPLFRLLCGITGKRLIVNIDGVEWRRAKYSVIKRRLLKLFDSLAQLFAHHVVYDNEGLYKYLSATGKKKSTCVAYPGDHVRRLQGTVQKTKSALTICRIEPENNLELLIEGALASKLEEYRIVGNWNHSNYSRALKNKYKAEKRLILLDPIYDAMKLAELRETCTCYLHGHSVGGTNPSLVEMLFYDCEIFCLDVEFNRQTASDSAIYFKTSEDLQHFLDGPTVNSAGRENLRKKYTSDTIANAYINVIRF